MPTVVPSDVLPIIQVRPIAADDAPELERFFARLSDESRRLRFFAAGRGASPAVSVRLCSPDHVHREGFVATTEDGPSDVTRIVGHVCLEPDGDGRAEIAIAVADELRRVGLGSRLVGAAVDWARDADVRILTATILSSNAAMHRLLGSLGLPVRLQASDLDATTAEITVPAAVAAA